MMVDSGGEDLSVRHFEERECILEYVCICESSRVDSCMLVNRVFFLEDIYVFVKGLEPSSENFWKVNLCI